MLFSLRCPVYALAGAVLLLGSHNALGAWAHKGNSAVVSDINAAGASITLTLPTHAAGDVLLASIGGYPSIACTSGWTQLEARDASIKLCGKIDSGSESNPVFVAGAHANSTIIGCVSSFSGGTLTIHASADAYTASSQDINVPARTVTEANTLVIAAGAGYLRLGGGSTNANGIAGFTESCDGQVDATAAGIDFNLAAAWVIQTTATNVAASTPGFDLAAGVANEGFAVIASLSASTATALLRRRRE